LSNSTFDGDAAYLRFESITVRAAVRVIRLQRAGVVSGIEADFYISELAAMDRHIGAQGASVLARLALRQASPERISRPRMIEIPAAQQVERRLAMAA
jgi:hypothetical protein